MPLPGFPICSGRLCRRVILDQVEIVYRAGMITGEWVIIQSSAFQSNTGVWVLANMKNLLRDNFSIRTRKKIKMTIFICMFSIDWINYWQLYYIIKYYLINLESYMGKLDISLKLNNAYASLSCSSIYWLAHKPHNACIQNFILIKLKFLNFNI